MQHQLTESKNQYHELSCYQARRSSPSRSPHGGLQHKMYMQVVRERDSLRISKAEVDKLYSQTGLNSLTLRTCSKPFGNISMQLARSIKMLWIKSIIWATIQMWQVTCSTGCTMKSMTETQPLLVFILKLKPKRNLSNVLTGMQVAPSRCWMTDDSWSKERLTIPFLKVTWPRCTNWPVNASLR